MLPGLDVSYAQGANLPWAAIYQHGERFAICRSSYGLDTVDKTFLPNVNGAREAGLLTGSYHFFLADQDPIAQARKYYDLAYQYTDLAPVIDLESLGFRGVDPPEVVRNAELFVAETKRLWCQRVIFYVNASDWEALGNPADSPLVDCPLWAAHYGVSKPLIPRPWRERGWTLWQWDGDRGQRLPDGRDSDFVWFAGETLEELRQISGSICSTEEPPPPPVYDGWESARSAVAELEAARKLRLRDRDDLGIKHASFLGMRWRASQTPP